METYVNLSYPLTLETQRESEHFGSHAGEELHWPFSALGNII